MIKVGPWHGVGVDVETSGPGRGQSRRILRIQDSCLLLRLRILYPGFLKSSSWGSGFSFRIPLRIPLGFLEVQDSWSSGFLKLRIPCSGFGILEAQDSWTSTVIEFKPPIILVYSKIFVFARSRRLGRVTSSYLGMFWMNTFPFTCKIWKFKKFALYYENNRKLQK